MLGAVKDGFNCGKNEKSADHNYFQMKGGTVNITNVADDGIDTGDYGTIRIEGGHLSVNVTDGGSALKADSIVSISGGTQNISVRGIDTKGIRASYAVNISGGQTDILVVGDGSKGIKGKCVADTVTNATVTNGGYVNISGGSISITAMGGNYMETLSSSPEEGETTEMEAAVDTVKCMALSVDADLLHTDGSVSLTAMGPEARTYNVNGSVTIQSETFVTRWLPWLFNVYDYQYDMTAYVVVSANGLLLTDYSTVAVAAFIGDACVGYADFETADYGILRIHSNDLSAQTVTFRLYDYTANMEYELTPAQTVTFSNSSVVATPTDPLVLNYIPFLKGDVNLDGQVGIGDIVAITNVMAGIEIDEGINARADVNDDGQVGIGDIVAITNIMAGKE